ncbi:MAG TPA: type II toxin-antitoxin system VapC family toxin [Vicinamibacterales bacterium]|nr:type II toxin-antitoxin system VapC family toxin [Vicinamibacterales bacterium]
MKYWDTSALVALLVSEPATAGALALLQDDPVMVVSWTTAVECASAVARAERGHLLAAAEVSAAFARLDALLLAWREVEPSTDQRDLARRLLRVHSLRSGDALQLAAALLAAEHRPATLSVVTCDDRLKSAAQREGFNVVDPVDAG